MAENKKSFIAYSDWKETFDQLPDEIAGKLIKHIFAYVNDENPSSDDYILNAVFANIKSTLKRDLIKWENQMNQRKEAGKRSAEIRASKINERSISFNETTRNSTVSVNDSVSVSVNVNGSSKEEKNNNYLNELLVSEIWLEQTAMSTTQKFNPNEIKVFLKSFNTDINLKFDYKANKSDYTTHFLNWLKLQPKNNNEGPTKKRVIS